MCSTSVEWPRRSTQRPFLCPDPEINNSESQRIQVPLQKIRNQEFQNLHLEFLIFRNIFSYEGPISEICSDLPISGPDPRSGLRSPAPDSRTAGGSQIQGRFRQETATDLGIAGGSQPSSDAPPDLNDPMCDPISDVCRSRPGGLDLHS